MKVNPNTDNPPPLMVIYNTSPISMELEATRDKALVLDQKPISLGTRTPVKVHFRKVTEAPMEAKAVI